MFQSISTLVRFRFSLSLPKPDWRSTRLIQKGEKVLLTIYLSDKNRFDVSSKGPSSGISVCVWGGGGGEGKARMFLYKWIY